MNHPPAVSRERPPASAACGAVATPTPIEAATTGGLDVVDLDAPAGCPGVERGGARACSAPEEPALLAHGWTRRFVGDPRMTGEATALYGRLGYEVMAIPLDAELAEEPCAGCAVTLRSFRVLYTRRPEK